MLSLKKLLQSKLTPFDRLHAQYGSQLYEVLTGEPFSVDLSKGSISFDRSDPTIKGQFKCLLSRDYLETADQPQGHEADFITWSVRYQFDFWNDHSDGKSRYFPKKCFGMVYAQRDFLTEFHLNLEWSHTDSRIKLYHVRGLLCSFSGRDYYDRAVTGLPKSKESSEAA